MPRPIPVRQIIRALERKGFFFVFQTGSHAKYRKPGIPTLTVIVPVHEKEVRYGTFRSILRQSKLNESDFTKKK
jgi:predicted RNA binding protein YcfA (HicA-like mRNA interferase family)